MTSADWPDEVLEQAIRKNLILVVGAGVSASCTNSAGDRPPGWGTLLDGIVDKLKLTARANEIRELVKKDRLLDAAELIRQEAMRVGKLQDMHKHIRDAVDGKHGSSYAGSEWHEAIVRMEPSIIVTTNYDRIIDRATSSAYNLHDYESETLAGDIRRGDPTLIKIHGSIDKIENIVLARTDYTRVRLHGVHTMKVLQALFLTRPALLLGYRLHDPDIQLLMENVFGGRGDTPAHYMLVSDSLPDYEADVLKFSYGVNAVTYPAGQYDSALKMVKHLGDVVENSAR